MLMPDGIDLAARSRFPDNCWALDPQKVRRGQTAFGCDVRKGSWDLLIGEVVRSQMHAAPVLRIVFSGKVRDEHDAYFFVRQYGCRFGVCDARPDGELVLRFQRACNLRGIRVWRANYNVAPSDIEIAENAKEMLLRIDRTMTLDAVHQAFVIGRHLALPQNYHDISGGEFERELKNPARVPTKHHSAMVWTWEGTPDHTFHAFNYLNLACRRGQLLMGGGNECMMSVPGLVKAGTGDVPMMIETGAKIGCAPKIAIDWTRVEALEDERDGVHWEA
jgi:hypothetical protein